MSTTRVLLTEILNQKTYYSTNSLTWKSLISVSQLKLKAEMVQAIARLNWEQNHIWPPKFICVNPMSELPLISLPQQSSFSLPSHSTHPSPRPCQRIPSTDWSAQTALTCSGKHTPRISQMALISSLRNLRTSSLQCYNSTQPKELHWLKWRLIHGTMAQSPLLKTSNKNSPSERSALMMRMRPRELLRSKRKPTEQLVDLLVREEFTEM